MCKYTCIYVYVYMYVSIWVCLYGHMYIYIYIYIVLCTLVYSYVGRNIYINIYMHLYCMKSICNNLRHYGPFYTSVWLLSEIKIFCLFCLFVLTHARLHYCQHSYGQQYTNFILVFICGLLPYTYFSSI